MESRTVRVSSLADVVLSEGGPVALLGDHGGISLITGAVALSGLVPGTASVETEHGTVYLDAEGVVEIVAVED